jgi:transposase
VRSGGRVPTSPEGLQILADSLGPEDHVALEATRYALAIARALEPHVAQVIVAARNELRAITEAKVKTDRRDARTLAAAAGRRVAVRLLAAGRADAGVAPAPGPSGAVGATAHAGKEWNSHDFAES